MSRLDGRVAVVTGAGRGIGRAIACKLAAEGAAVVVNDLDAAAADETVAAIVRAGGRAVACPGSITDAQLAPQLVAAALANFGELHILVNNAGYTWDGVIQKMSDEQFDAMLDVHVRGPFRLLRAAAEHFRAAAKREAAAGREVFRKVVNVSSVSAVAGNAGQVNYSAAKAALHGMTRTLAREWGRYRVNVNCVAFGYIDTRLTAPSEGEHRIEIGGRSIPAGVPRAGLDAVIARIPLGRPGRPEEAAGAVYLLCLPESDYISGQVLVAGGGFAG